MLKRSNAQTLAKFLLKNTCITAGMYKHNRRKASNFGFMNILVEKFMVLNRLFNNGMIKYLYRYIVLYVKIKP